MILVGPSILKTLKDVETVEGKPLELICDVSGTPKPEFTWFKGEQAINNDEHYTLSVNNDSYSMLIKNSKEADTGLYRAVFTNEFGTSETKANANVLSKLF